MSGQGFTSAGQTEIPAQPDLRYWYLRVAVDGHPPGLLVLGYVDGGAPDGADMEVWYSANQEVIKARNGRVVATSGLANDWLAVRTLQPPPAWRDVPQAGAFYARARDERKHSRFGVEDQVRVLPSAMPQAPVLNAMGVSVAQASHWRWFKESDQSPHKAPGARLPDAWFAWGTHRGVETVVASFQCLDPQFCMALTRWPQDGAGRP